MNTTKLMERLFSGQEPDFSQKVQEGIAEAREKGNASMPEEHLEFSADAEGKVEIKDAENKEVTVATPNPEDPMDEKLSVGKTKEESEAEEAAARKAAEEAEKAEKKAELEQQIATNLEELNKATSDMKESHDKKLAGEIKEKADEMSKEIEELPEDLGIDKEKVQSDIKAFSDQADAVLAEPDQAPVTEEVEVKVEAECGDKKFSISFPKGTSGDYVASFMKAFSEKVEEIKAEEEAAIEAQKSESEQEPEQVIANNIQEIGKAVEDLKKDGDKELAEKVEEKIAEVKEQIEEAKKSGIDVEKMESDLKTFSEAVDEAKKSAEEAAARKEAEEAEKAKSFSQLDDYLGMAPKGQTKKDKTFSAKEVEESKDTLGGCLFHKF